jgi:PST family polysaccharide transporter/lipopolysaccharide exporter
MHDQLRRQAVIGVGWAFFSSISVRVIQVVATLALAKLLMPADFGVFALSALIVSAAAIFRDVGLAQVLIYKQEDIGRIANTAFYLSAITSLALAGLLFLTASAIGRAFDSSAIVLPIQAMSAGLLISGTANVPLALLDKALKFKLRSVPEIAGAVAYALVSLGLGAAGYHAWSLVIGWIAMTAVTTLSAWLVCPWRPGLEFGWEEARVIVRYGKHLMAAALLGFAFFQADNASVGKWLGVTALGFYSIAFTVCNLPATNLSHVVNRVMFPTYSRVQEDLFEMRGLYLRTIKYISLAAFPAAVGIMVLADPIIRTFYQEKWIPAIPLFHILALYGLMRSIGATPGVVFMSTGNPQLVRRVAILQLVIAGALVYPVAEKFGTTGVAVLFTVAYLIGTAYSLWKVQRILEIEPLGCVKAVALPLSAAGTAGLLAWVVSSGMNPDGWLTVAATGAIMGCAYGALVAGLDRKSFGEVRGMLIKAREGGAPWPA